MSPNLGSITYWTQTPAWRFDPITVPESWKVIHFQTSWKIKRPTFAGSTVDWKFVTVVAIAIITSIGVETIVSTFINASRAFINVWNINKNCVLAAYLYHISEAYSSRGESNKQICTVLQTVWKTYILRDKILYHNTSSRYCREIFLMDRNIWNYRVC